MPLGAAMPSLRGGLNAPTFVGAASAYQASAGSATSIPMPAGAAVGDHSLVIVSSLNSNVPVVTKTGALTYNTRQTHTKHATAASPYVSAFTSTFESSGQVSPAPTINHGADSIIIHVVSRNQAAGGNANATSVGFDNDEVQTSTGSTYPVPAWGVTARGTLVYYVLASRGTTHDGSPVFNTAAEGINGPPVLEGTGLSVGNTHGLRVGYERLPAGANPARVWRLSTAGTGILGQIIMTIPIEGP